MESYGGGRFVSIISSFAIDWARVWVAQPADSHVNTDADIEQKQENKV